VEGPEKKRNQQKSNCRAMVSVNGAFSGIIERAGVKNNKRVFLR